MKKYLRWAVPAVALAATIAGSAITSARADDLIVGVSWSNFQEERWKTDEAAIKAALDAAGAKYISADAQSDPTKQLNDVQSLIAGGAKALIVLAQDAKAIEPAITAALIVNFRDTASSCLAMPPRSRPHRPARLPRAGHPHPPRDIRCGAR